MDWSFRRTVRTYKNTYVRWVCSGRNGRGANSSPNKTVVDAEELIEVLQEYFTNVLKQKKNICISICMDNILFVPLAWLFHYHGLKAVWMTFPVTEVIVAAACILVYMKEERRSSDGRAYKGQTMCKNIKR